MNQTDGFNQQTLGETSLNNLPSQDIQLIGQAEEAEMATPHFWITMIHEKTGPT